MQMPFREPTPQTGSNKTALVSINGKLEAPTAGGFVTLAISEFIQPVGTHAWISTLAQVLGAGITPEKATSQVPSKSLNECSRGEQRGRHTKQQKPGQHHGVPQAQGHLAEGKTRVEEQTP